MISEQTSRRRFLIASAGVASLSGCVGDNGAVPGSDGETDDDSGGSNALIDQLPGEAATIIHASAALREDVRTRELLDVLARQDFGGSLEEIEDDFEMETGLDLSDISEAVFFSTRPFDGRNDELAFILHTEWSIDDIVDLLEAELGHEYEASEYAGESDVLYAPAAPDDDVDPIDRSSDALRIGVLGENAFVLGERMAVVASLDTVYGESDGIDDEVRSVWTETSEASLRVMSEISGDVLPRPNEDVDLSSFEHATIASFAFASVDDDFRMTAEARFASDARAEDALTNLLAFRETLEAEVPADELFENLLEPIELDGDERSVEVTYRIDASELIDALDTLAEPEDDPPLAALAADIRDDEIIVMHQGGDTLDADQIVISANGRTLTWAQLEGSGPVQAGEAATLEIGTVVQPGDRVEIAIVDQSTGTRRVVQRVTVPDENGSDGVPDADFRIHTDPTVIFIEHEGGDVIPGSDLHVYVGQASSTWASWAGDSSVSRRDTFILERSDYDWPSGMPVRLVWRSPETGEEVILVEDVTA